MQSSAATAAAAPPRLSIKQALTKVPALRHDLEHLNHLARIDHNTTVNRQGGLQQRYVPYPRLSGNATGANAGAPDGVVAPTGVYDVVQSYFSKFNKDRAFTSIMTGESYRTDPTYVYRGMTPKDMAAFWNENSDRGTLLHKLVDYFYDQTRASTDAATSERACQQVMALVDSLRADDAVPMRTEFLQFYAFHVLNVVNGSLVPFRVELNVTHPHYGLSGKIDMVYLVTERDENGVRHPMVDPDTGARHVALYDWKVTASVDSNRTSSDQTKFPLHKDVPDTTFWKFAMQINTYRLMLEDMERLHVRHMGLVVVHSVHETFRDIPVPDLRDYALYVCEQRWKDIYQARIAASLQEHEALLTRCTPDDSAHHALRREISNLHTQVKALHDSFRHHTRGIPLHENDTNAVPGALGVSSQCVEAPVCTSSDDEDDDKDDDEDDEDYVADETETETETVTDAPSEPKRAREGEENDEEDVDGEEEEEEELTDEAKAFYDAAMGPLLPSTPASSKRKRTNPTGSAVVVKSNVTK